MITQEEQQNIIDRFGNGPDDTGTPVQIAIFTKRIEHLTEHLEDHPNDNSTRQGLLDLVGKRRRLLNYLQENEIERYRTIRDELELRK